MDSLTFGPNFWRYRGRSICSLTGAHTRHFFRARLTRLEYPSAGMYTPYNQNQPVELRDRIFHNNITVRSASIIIVAFLRVAKNEIVLRYSSNFRLVGTGPFFKRENVSRRRVRFSLRNNNDDDVYRPNGHTGAARAKRLVRNTFTANDDGRWRVEENDYRSPRYTRTSSPAA